MALSVVRVLDDHGRVDQDALASAFAGEYRREPWRGYASGAAKLLMRYRVGLSWREEAPLLFGGGSFGNGAAMRVAPLGAFFADDVARVAVEAEASAIVTHAHPEGVAGAVAVALAAAAIAGANAAKGETLLTWIAEQLPHGQTRERLTRAAAMGDETPRSVAEQLGCGFEVTAFDTVPFCLWVVAFHSDSLEDALWTTVAVGGDRDTTCAIVGGVLAADRRPLPSLLSERVEPLPSWTEC